MEPVPTVRTGQYLLPVQPGEAIHPVQVIQEVIARVVLLNLLRDPIAPAGQDHRPEVIPRAEVIHPAGRLHLPGVTARAGRPVHPEATLRVLPDRRGRIARVVPVAAQEAVEAAVEAAGLPHPEGINKK